MFDPKLAGTRHHRTATWPAANSGGRKIVYGENREHSHQVYAKQGLILISYMAIPTKQYPLQGIIASE
jgi:hypothetical protein